MKVHLLCYALVVLFVAVSCEKDDHEERPTVTPDNNLPPIARAGDDISLTLTSCEDITEIELDGSGSSDPDGSIVSYRWREIQGTRASRIRNTDPGKAKVTNMAPGIYQYVLTVKDAKGASASDTVGVNITAPIRQYDLDITFNSNFLFTDNFDQCDWDYYWDCPSDLTEIFGEADFPPLNGAHIRLVESADTAAASEVVKYSYMELYFGSGHDTYLFGGTNVNFKKLLRQGGGNFSGTLEIHHGSAATCNPETYENAPPLHFSGRLDAATKTATLTVKGPVYLQ